MAAGAAPPPVPPAPPMRAPAPEPFSGASAGDSGRRALPLAGAVRVLGGRAAAAGVGVGMGAGNSAESAGDSGGVAAALGAVGAPGHGPETLALPSEIALVTDPRLRLVLVDLESGRPMQVRACAGAREWPARAQARRGRGRPPSTSACARDNAPSLSFFSTHQSAAKCPFRLTFLVEPCAGPDAALATYERGLARWRAEQARAAAMAAAARTAVTRARAHPHLTATHALSHAHAPATAFVSEANLHMREGAHDAIVRARLGAQHAALVVRRRVRRRRVQAGAALEAARETVGVGLQVSARARDRGEEGERERERERDASPLSPPPHLVRSRNTLTLSCSARAQRCAHA